ncbi:MAG: hypothetical protein ACOC4K_00380 [Verrucomicrobiota bacterium]
MNEDTHTEPDYQGVAALLAMRAMELDVRPDFYGDPVAETCHDPDQLRAWNESYGAESLKDLIAEYFALMLRASRRRRGMRAET